MYRHSRRAGGGFSLIELLVVILIISLMLTLGAAGLRGMGAGKGVSSGVTTAQALVDEARSIAIGQGTTTRLLIDARNPSDSENYLRRMLIVAKEVGSDGAMKANWVMTGRPTMLPDRVFFSKAFSTTDVTKGGGPLKTDSIAMDKSLNDGDYYYYEFNSQGICQQPGSGFVLGSGARQGSNDPRVTGEGKRDFGGFAIWRNGHTSTFRDSEQMHIPAQVTEF